MENQLPKISVITVCFNAAHLLKKTIESVLDQTYGLVEYIIIDGDSKDNTIEIVKSYGSKIHKFVSETDSGLYEAMNKGIKHATGEFIIFLNAGDYYLTPYVLEYTISKINKKTPDILFGRILWEDPHNKNIILSDHHFVWYEWDLKFSNFPHPATIYKKKLFTDIGTFDESYSILADYEWNVKALVKHQIAFQYLDIAMTLFRADGTSHNPANAGRIQNERMDIYKRYFKPEWLFSFIEMYNDNNHGTFIKKVLGKLFKKKLKRIY